MRNSSIGHHDNIIVAVFENAENERNPEADAAAANIDVGPPHVYAVVSKCEGENLPSLSLSHSCTRQVDIMVDGLYSMNSHQLLFLIEVARIMIS